jgi:hypothetical protein
VVELKILPVVRSSNQLLPLAEKCKNSWDYFHQDIPMNLIMVDDWTKYIDEIGFTPRSGIHGVIVHLVYAMQKMMTEHYDLAIFVDADTVTVGRCNEIISGNFDISVSNGVNDNFYNNGVWACTDLNFIKDYLYTYNAGLMDDLNLFPYAVKHYKEIGKHIKVLDDHAVWYNERSRSWWGRLIIKDDKLITCDNTDSRQIKIMHWAGGFTSLESKMSCSLFSDEVKQWLNKITDGTTFTDYDGIDFGDFLKRTYGI